MYFHYESSVCFQQQSDAVAASAEWCQAHKSFLIMIHHIFMRKAVWAVNDVLFYYYISNVSRLTCMLKRLLIKHGSPCNLSLPCQYQPLYKRWKHFSTLINAIKWSNNFSATVTVYVVGCTKPTATDPRERPFITKAWIYQTNAELLAWSQKNKSFPFAWTLNTEVIFPLDRICLEK